MNANFPEFMDGPEFAYYYNVAQMMDQLASGAIANESEYIPHFTSDQVALMLNGDPTDGWDNVNYIDKVFGTGFTQKHNITVQGGTEKTRYFASFGYLGQNGNIDNFNYDRYNIRTNIEADLADNFKFNLGLSGVLSNRHTPAFNSGGTDANSDLDEQGWLSIASQTIIMHPYLPERYNGLYTATPKKNTSLPQSPLAAIYESGYKKTRSLDVSANMALSYDVPWLAGLQLKVSGAFDYGTSMNKNLNTPFDLMMYSAGQWSEVADPRGKGDGVSLGEGSTYYQYLTGQASVSYVNTFGKNFVEALALAEISDRKSNAHSAYAKLIPFDALPELGYGQPANSPIGGWSGASRSAGYVFRVRYNWDERYLAEVTGRYDGSYKFAGMRTTRWGFFPSASIAWNLAKEPWMQNATNIDDFKIRGSVALLGNDNIGAYMFLNTYSKYYQQIIYGDKTGNIIKPGYADSSLANPELTWEKSLSYNVGVDYKMWGGKLAVEADAFYRYNFDLLTYMGSDYPPSMGGYYMGATNHNAYDTKGIDVMISHRSHFMAGGKPFQYGVSGTVTYARSRWIIYGDQPNIPENQKVVGKPLGAVMAWTADGLYRSEEEIDNSAWYGTRPNVGDIKYVDLNGDGKIDGDDKGFIGRTNRPELTFGLNLDFRWNNIGLSLFFQGVGKRDWYPAVESGFFWGMYNRPYSYLMKDHGGDNYVHIDYSTENWTVTNADKKPYWTRRVGYAANRNVGPLTWENDYYLQNAAYFRLKNMTIDYTLPKELTEKKKISQVKFYLAMENLFTWSPIMKHTKMFDPEVIDSGDSDFSTARGLNGQGDGFSYPMLRSFTFGVNLTF